MAASKRGSIRSKVTKRTKSKKAKTAAAPPPPHKGRQEEESKEDPLGRTEAPGDNDIMVAAPVQPSKVQPLVAAAADEKKLKRKSTAVKKKKGAK
jgi:hypothetical protein